MLDEQISLGERDVDLALQEFLAHDPSFRDWFLNQIGCASFVLSDGGVFIEAVRSTSSRDGGQTDVIARWSNATSTLVVLIESKLNAGFQKRQGARYRERALRANSAEKTARTVLVAPRQYLSMSNVQASYFDARVSLEDILEEMRKRPHIGPANFARVEESLRRVEGKLTLGAKGLYHDDHRRIHAECERRGNGFHIDNKPTAVLFISFPGAPRGVKLKYRARPKDRLAELMLNKAFSGSLHAVIEACAPEFIAVRRGTEVFVRSTAPSIAPSPDAVDAAAVVNDLERLVTWWRTRGAPAAHVLP